jgi:hypothetical protein
MRWHGHLKVSPRKARIGHRATRARPVSPSGPGLASPYFRRVPAMGSWSSLVGRPRCGSAEVVPAVDAAHVVDRDDVAASRTWPRWHPPPAPWPEAEAGHREDEQHPRHDDRSGHREADPILDQIRGKGQSQPGRGRSIRVMRGPRASPFRPPPRIEMGSEALGRAVAGEQAHKALSVCGNPSQGCIICYKPLSSTNRWIARHRGTRDPIAGSQSPNLILPILLFSD